MNEIPNLDALLLTVQKPARYIGGEWNAVTKPWADDTVKVLLAFPDTYEVGMSHLGTKIIYGLLNKRADCLCERAFAPWPDFEAVLRTNGLPLFSLESRRPLKAFDIVGFSLTYELSYTNVLNMLDLGGIPKRSAERSDRDPIVIAGGGASYNPEPMAEFVDAFVIGEGEEVTGEIIEAYRNVIRRTQGAGRREEVLRALAAIEGVYVPSFYEVDYNPDGTIRKFASRDSAARATIKKRVVKDFEHVFYPVDQVVPYIQIVHDRITIEIMRGCKHACTFCQAATLYRPCRERSVERILAIAEEAYRSTGHDEISLLSLSSGDHSRIADIITGLNAAFRQRAVSVSLPSLRIEDALQGLPLLIAEVKKSTLTLAPEAGSVRLRRSMNKNIDIDKLFTALAESFKAGWRKVKLYFLIGLPTETDDDIRAIAQLVKDVSEAKRAVDGRAALVTASVNALIPKPHTPFQWEAMASAEEITRRRNLLRASVTSKSVDVDFHSLEMGIIEAVFSRGDRRLGAAIAAAWEAGGRFDGWRDHFNFSRWCAALEKAGLDAAFYVTRPRDYSEILPWDFIDTGMPRDLLFKLSRPLPDPQFDNPRVI